jgi:hypothetical protein
MVGGAVIIHSSSSYRFNREFKLQGVSRVTKRRMTASHVAIWGEAKHCEPMDSRVRGRERYEQARRLRL